MIIQSDFSQNLDNTFQVLSLSLCTLRIGHQRLSASWTPLRHWKTVPSIWTTLGSSASGEQEASAWAIPESDDHGRFTDHWLLPTGIQDWFERQEAGLGSSCTHSVYWRGTWAFALQLVFLVVRNFCFPLFYFFLFIDILSYPATSTLHVPAVGWSGPFAEYECSSWRIQCCLQVTIPISFAIQIAGITTIVNLLCFLHFLSVNLVVQIDC